MIGNDIKYPVPFLAESSMPACAVMEANGVTTRHGHVCVKARAYTGDSPNPLLLVNSPAAVSANSYGSASLTMLGIVRAAGSATAGKSCGPTANSTSISANGRGFIAVGSGANTTTYVVAQYPTTLIGKLTGSLSQGGTANVAIWAGTPGSESNTGIIISGHDWVMKSGATSVNSGKKVFVQVANNAYYITQVECP